VVLSDLFERVESIFDTILFSAPWSEGEIRRPGHAAIFENGFTVRFLDKARAHLASEGCIWLQYCDASRANFDYVVSTFRTHGYVEARSFRNSSWDLATRARANVVLFELRLRRL
jgi:hypothetical protein